MPSKMMKPPAKKVNVAGQEHTLAYINKSKARMLRRMGGSGKPGPSGIPTYYDEGDDYSGPGGDQTGDDMAQMSKDESDRDAGRRRDRQTLAKAQADLAASKAKEKADNIAKAKKQLQDRIKNKNITGVGAYTPMGMAINFGNKAMRTYMGKQLDDPNLVDVIFDDQGKYVGNVTKGLFGTNVYTGKQIAGYTGKYANIVAQDPTGSDKDDRVQAKIVQDYGGGKLSEDQKDGVNLELPDAPDTPGDVGDGDQTEEAKKKSSLGQESTIGTSAQGLLSGARTRRRSLMSGLLT